MVTKKSYKKVKNYALGAAGLGITTAVVAGVGAPAGVTSGLNTVSKFYGIAGTAVGAGMALDATKELQKKGKKKKKYGFY